MLYQTAPPSQGTFILHLIIISFIAAVGFCVLLLAGGFGYMLDLKVFSSRPKLIVPFEDADKEKIRTTLKRIDLCDGNYSHP